MSFTSSRDPFTFLISSYERERERRRRKSGREGRKQGRQAVGSKHTKTRTKDKKLRWRESQAENTGVYVSLGN